MTIKSLGAGGLVAAGLFALALPLTLSQVNAQEATPGEQGPGIQGRPGQQPPMPPQGPGAQIRPGGGGASMVLDQTHLYILQGNRLFKVDKGNLRVTAEGQLPPPQRPGGEPGQPRRGGPPPGESATE